MKHLILIFLFSISIVFGQTNPKHVYVEPYVKKDGTQVEGHYRTAPNSTNTDNFSTKPNTNPYTGKEGWITPDNNSNYSTYPNSGYSNYSTSTPTYGRLSLFSNYGAGGAIDLYIDGNFVGTSTKYFPTGTPDCSNDNMFHTLLKPGYYNYKAIDKTGFYWTGTINISANSCETISLLDSKDNRFRKGRIDGKNRRVRILNYVLPFVSTVIFPPLGIGVSSLMGVARPINSTTGDINYDKGYRKSIKRKRAFRIGISCGAGLATWFAYTRLM